MIVVDTNIIGYLYLTSEHSSLAEQVLLKDPHWIAPLLWRSELRNVLALYIRKKILSLPEVHQVMEEALHLMQDQEFEVTSHQILDLVAVSTCSAYDCEFIALAKDFDILLITSDRQIINQFPDIAISPQAFVGG
jgi:predicted nucleic acid-binding protein